MHQVFAVGKTIALSLCSRARNHRAHGCRLPNHERRNVVGDEPHRVDNPQACSNAATGTVHVDADVGLFVLVGKEQQLSNHEVGHAITNGAAAKYDAVVEQSRIYVVRALAAAGLLNDDRYLSHG